jgi:hypothetical protein
MQRISSLLSVWKRFASMTGPWTMPSHANFLRMASYNKLSSLLTIFCMERQWLRTSFKPNRVQMVLSFHVMCPHMCPPSPQRYESSSTQAHLGGRTETIRPASIESKAFVQAALSGSVSLSDQNALLGKRSTFLSHTYSLVVVIGLFCRFVSSTHHHPLPRTHPTLILNRRIQISASFQNALQTCRGSRIWTRIRSSPVCC